MTIPRSLLFVPANRTGMFARAWASEAGAIVLDLEDSVPAEQKAAARDALTSLQPPDGWAGPIFARLNAYGSADFDADVRAAVGAPLAGVILPKVEHAADVQAADYAFRVEREAPMRWEE